MMPDDSSHCRTHLLGRRKSFPNHDAAEILLCQAGIKGGGTNINVTAVLVGHKPNQVRREVDVEKFCKTMSLVQLGQITGIQEAAILR